MEVAGLNESVQLLNVTLNGTSMALKATGQLAHFVAHELKELLKFIFARYQEIKNRPETLSPGETEIFDFLKTCNKNNEAVGAIAMDKDLMEEFSEFAQKQGVSYSKMFETQGNPNEVTILYRQSEAYAFQGFVMTHRDHARISSVEEYQRSITDVDRANADAIAEMTPERLQKFAQLFADKNRERESIPVSRNSITGVSESVCEIRTIDEQGGELFVEVPRNFLKFDGENFKILLDPDVDYDAYRETGFQKDADGNIIEKERADKEKKPMSGKNMKKLSERKEPGEKSEKITLLNSKTGDKKTIASDAAKKTATITNIREHRAAAPAKAR